jgi:hypothetical protein
VQGSEILTPTQNIKAQQRHLTRNTNSPEGYSKEKRYYLRVSDKNKKIVLLFLKNK